MTQPSPDQAPSSLRSSPPQQQVIATVTNGNHLLWASLILDLACLAALVYCGKTGAVHESFIAGGIMAIITGGVVAKGRQQAPSRPGTTLSGLGGLGVVGPLLAGLSALLWRSRGGV